VYAGVCMQEQALHSMPHLVYRVGAAISMLVSTTINCRYAPGSSILWRCWAPAGLRMISSVRSQQQLYSRLCLSLTRHVGQECVTEVLL
jgi:hypothetical protein